MHWILLIATFAALAVIYRRVCWPRRTLTLSNAWVGRHAAGRLSRTADVAFPQRYLLAKLGDSDDDIDLCAAADEPLGVCQDEIESGDLAERRLAVFVPPFSEGTQIAVAAAAVNAGDALYTGDGGKVTNVPVPGCFHVGRALRDVSTAGATAGGEEAQVEFAPARFGTPFVYRQKVTLAGGGASEAVPITGLTAAMHVSVNVSDNGANNDASLLEAIPSGDTLTLTFNEDPGAGLVVDITIAPTTVAAVDLGA